MPHADLAKNAKSKTCDNDSHRSHKSREERIAITRVCHPARTLGNADKRGRSDSPSV